MTKSKRIIIATFGSLGDVNPYIAIAKELKSRGFSVAIATTRDHENRVMVHGVEFFPVGPEVSKLAEKKPDLMKQIMDDKTGSEFVLREIVMANLESHYEQLMEVTADADLLVTHTISYAALLVARKRNVPFVSSILSPVNFWSKHDAPAMRNSLWLPAVHRIFGSSVSGAVMNQMKKAIYSWGDPYRDLQRKLGLEVDMRNVFFEGQHSPIKALGLFSPVFGPPQPDWPPNAMATGFCFLDEDEFIPEDTVTKVRDFLQSGEAPVVFTLGSSAVWDAGNFYLESVKALKLLGMRGVLLTGPSADVRLPAELPDSVIAVDYLPHSLIFRHARVVVHQGGVGTTAQALRSGAPELVIPHSHDQFDNARRVKNLGCGLSGNRHNYKARVIAEAVALLTTRKFHDRAADVAKMIQAEDGVGTAATQIANAVIATA